MMEISLDMAREALQDYLEHIFAYRCNSCGLEFYFVDDTAKFCPKCGGMHVEPQYNRDVELLDWGYRRDA